jgi:hypothetical protein
VQRHGRRLRARRCHIGMDVWHLNGQDKVVR